MECIVQSSLEAWSPVDQKVSPHLLHDNSFNENVLPRNGSDVDNDVCLNVSLPTFSSGFY